MRNINIFILVLLLTGCNLSSSITKENGSVTIDIYAFNDLHGRVSEDQKESVKFFSELGLNKFDLFTYENPHQ